MSNIIGVRFHEAGKVYYFDAAGMELDVGEFVIVETVRGIEVGRVVIAPDQVLASEHKEPLKPVLRVAERSDVEQMRANREKATADLQVVKAKIAEHGLPMQVVAAEYNFDRSQYTVYFTATERVDFRNLVRDLTGALDTRVQLLQVGERDRAKLVGGLGRCGRHVCCSSWLTSFPSISVKIAKEQDLPLNPSKISGICGRLLCCLAYEYDQYKELRGNLPKVGTVVSTPVGNAKVVGISTLNQRVTIQFLETLTYHELTIDELKLQYGLTVRPLDVQEMVERSIHEAEEEANILSAVEAKEPAAVPVAAGSIAAGQDTMPAVMPISPTLNEQQPVATEERRPRRRRRSRRKGAGQSQPRE